MTADEKTQSSRDASNRYNKSPQGAAHRKKYDIEVRAPREKAREKWKRPDEKHRARIKNAKKFGYAAPPPESECPPRPEDGFCDCCLRPTKRFALDHDHVTGAFRGWICSGCNTGHGLPDDVDRLQARIDFLKRALPWQ